MSTREFAGSLFAIIIGILYFVEMKVNMWTFHFIHDNIFHVCGNLLALSYMHKSFNWKLFPVAYLTGSFTWLITQNAVGLSAIIFFMLGSTYYESSRKMKLSDKILSYLVISPIFILPTIIPKLSFTLHFIPFVVGFIVGILQSSIAKFNNDIKGITL